MSSFPLTRYLELQVSWASECFQKDLAILVHIMWFPACSRLLTEYITSLDFVFWSFFACEVLHFDFVLLSFLSCSLLPPLSSFFLLHMPTAVRSFWIIFTVSMIFFLTWRYDSMPKSFLLTKQCNSKHRI